MSTKSMLSFTRGSTIFLSFGRLPPNRLIADTLARAPAHSGRLRSGSPLERFSRGLDGALSASRYLHETTSLSQVCRSTINTTMKRDPKSRPRLITLPSRLHKPRGSAACSTIVASIAAAD